MDERERGGDGEPDGRGPRKRKLPRKVSPRSLENVALYYLKRYASTVASLRRVLNRRVDRSVRVHGGDRDEARGWVDALLERLVQGGYLNDASYARTKAHSLRAGGRSTRMIAQKLQLKGVARDVVNASVAGAAREVDEEEAARIWARKKRLGPFRKDPSSRKDHRQKDLASLARAGFAFTIAKKIVDATDV